MRFLHTADWQGGRKPHFFARAAPSFSPRAPPSRDILLPAVTQSLD